jgi:amino acid adenylation domain-containing protein
LEQLRLLLTQIVAKPDETISNFSLLTSRAEAILPNPSQQLGVESEETILTRFSQQVQRVPNHVAVRDKREAWSYRELDQRSSKLANCLLRRGIKAQDIVAVYSERNAALVWALLSVLKAGAAFVILDPSYPAARLINCLREAQPRGWLEIATGEVMPDVLEKYLTSVSFRCRLKVPQPASDLLEEYSIDQPDITVLPDDLAYVAFTSGSTGIPKGIQGAHGPLSHFIQWHSATFSLNESDRFSMLSGLAHDPLLRDVFTPLCLGATLCIPDSEIIESPGQLARWMTQEQISIIHLTPAMGQVLTNTTTETNLPALRYAFYGADALRQSDVVKLRRIAPAATCVNFYGATETPQAAGYFLTPDQEDPASSDVSNSATIPIGRGIKDFQLLILSSSQKLAGISEVGEIYVRSSYLAKGYLGDDELTRERFITNPFTRRAGDYLYRTGDLGRYLPNGDVKFVGRSDQQVKIRGYRIELSEIEAALSEHPAVREIVAIAREDASGEKRLVAYVVADQEAPSVSELRAFLKEKLPGYMIPTAFVPLDQLPLTPNGKIDCKALPVPDFARPASDRPYLAPCSPVEEILAGIWAEMLKVERVGIYDNFFELGGHSLLATQVMSRVREAFQVELSLRVLFEKPTVQQLALAITEGQMEQKDGSTNVITKNTRRGNEYLLAKVDQFSEKDLDALLSRVLP